MERMCEHTVPISSLSLLLVQKQAVRWKAATPEQLTDAHLYLDMAKSGYLFHGYSGAMLLFHRILHSLIFQFYDWENGNTLLK